MKRERLPIGYTSNERFLVIYLGMSAGMLAGSAWPVSGVLIGAALGAFLGWWLSRVRRARVARVLIARQVEWQRRTEIHEAGHVDSVVKLHERSSVTADEMAAVLPRRALAPVLAVTSPEGFVRAGVQMKRDVHRHRHILDS